MGGKRKDERRMGMHGEARESMKEAWGCMGGNGGKGKHKRRMGKHDRRMGMHGRRWDQKI